MRPTISIGILFTVFISLLLPIGTPGQENPEWTWKDGSGNVKSQADLDKILAAHNLWATSRTITGIPARLNHADLDGADLDGAELGGTARDDTASSTTYQLFAGADLNGAKLIYAHLRGAILLRANLTGADLTDADLTGAELTDTELVGAYLDGTVLNDARLSGADLTDAELFRANLTDAELTRAKLAGANLKSADLTRADMFDADLNGAIFEPKTLPLIEKMARAKNLELITYSENSGPLTQLRQQLHDAGFHEAERKITHALNREETARAPFIEQWFKKIAFDYTCRYGLSPGRPLRILCWFWLICSFVYSIFIHLPSTNRTGIYLIATYPWIGRPNTRGIRIRPRPIRTGTKWWEFLFLWLWREWRLLRTAMFFSLMSAFNIGFRDINFGRWLRLLTRREYDLKAAGWARTISGMQSLLSVYMIALWVLTYFGRPFG
jgi:uncharacterized protein YjbI with pentapeptide repeats